MPKQNKSYIDITYMGQSESGKTSIWYVRNKSDPENDIPGIIKWNGAWRKYVYYTHPSFYDANCLREIADFIEHQMDMHKNKDKAPLL